MTRARTMLAYFPETTTEPHATFADNGIPALYVTGVHSTTDDIRLQFRPSDLAEAVRYLRQLAAVATDLADQCQDAIAKAVLEG